MARPEKKERNKEILLKHLQGLSYREIGEIYRIDRSAVWRVVRRFTRLGYNCIFCDKKMGHIHHADLDRTNNDKSNLISLCSKCHEKIHNIIIKPLAIKYGFTKKERLASVDNINVDETKDRE